MSVLPAVLPRLQGAWLTLFRAIWCVAFAVTLFSAVGATLLEKWQLPAQLVASIRYHHDPQSAGDFEKIAAAVAIGDCLTHGVDRPESTRSPAFIAALEILRLDSSHLKRWNRQFTESGDLIAGMSKLPL